MLERRIDHLELHNIHSDKRQIENCHNTYTKIPQHVMVEPPDDPCEILVTGLPRVLSLSPTEIVKRLLLFIGLSNAINYVFSTRSWKPKHFKGTTNGLVIRFSSPIVRNEVLKKIRCQKNFNSGIFGSVDNNRLNVTDLLPKSMYLLFLKARKLYKTLNYDPPIIKNGVIYMRKDSYSTFIPIFTHNNLINLPILT